MQQQPELYTMGLYKGRVYCPVSVNTHIDIKYICTNVRTCTCIFVRMYVRMHACTYNIYIYMYVCMYVCVSVCMPMLHSLRFHSILLAL